MKSIFFRFGSGDTATFTGLSPTLTVFSNQNGGATTAPGITEIISGQGIYRFQAAASTLAIVFKIDGGASLANSDRYVIGVLDPVQAVDEQLGWKSDSFGTSLADPTTALGVLNRLQENLEGNNVFTKSSGQLVISTRGSSTTLAVKTLSNTSSQVTKS